MSYKTTLKKYFLIIEKINRGTYPNMKDIRTKLDNFDLSCSQRTIERYIEAIRDEFGIEIIYNTYRKGYYIDKENSLDFDSYFNFLKFSQEANLLVETLRDGQNACKYIHFDADPNRTGIEFLKPLLRAIKDQQVVHLTYRSFNKIENKSFRFKPELLKEYMYRWYVIGFASYAEQPRVYALDRIQDCFVSSMKFDRKLGDADEVFGDIIGVNFSGDKIEKIVLSFTPFQGNYIRSMPMHRSQEIITDNESEFRIAIRVKPNMELKQKIQMYGTEVEVVEPIGLLDSIG